MDKFRLGLRYLGPEQSNGGVGVPPESSQVMVRRASRCFSSCAFSIEFIVFFGLIIFSLFFCFFFFFKQGMNSMFCFSCSIEL
ncbi:hypothetical protein AMTRI_Chr12g268040 [Amborella trichopoda]